MPHQCLKCGVDFPEGSSEILKGCPSCGGTKFFYTEAPLSDSQRQDLTNRASEDIGTLVNDIMAGRGIDDAGPIELSDLEKEASKRPEKDETDTFEGTLTPLDTGSEGGLSGLLKGLRGRDRSAPEGGEWVRYTPKGDKLHLHKASDLVKGMDDEFRREPRPRPKRRGRIRVRGKDGEKVRRPLRKRIRREKLEADDRETPEVISIVEPGVYEIDLEALLDSSPIIVQKDGTYLIYLPSLFKRLVRRD